MIYCSGKIQKVQSHHIWKCEALSNEKYDSDHTSPESRATNPNPLNSPSFPWQDRSSTDAWWDTCTLTVWPVRPPKECVGLHTVITCNLSSFRCSHSSPHRCICSVNVSWEKKERGMVCKKCKWNIPLCGSVCIGIIVCLCVHSSSYMHIMCGWWWSSDPLLWVYFLIFLSLDLNTVIEETRLYLSVCVRSNIKTD